MFDPLTFIMETRRSVAAQSNIILAAALNTGQLSITSTPQEQQGSRARRPLHIKTSDDNNTVTHLEAKQFQLHRMREPNKRDDQ